MHKETQNSKSSFGLSFNRNLILTKFFETAPVLMGVVELDGDDIRHVLDNDESGKFFGVSSRSMSGNLASELGISQEKINFWRSQYLKAEKDSRSVTFEFQHEDKILSVKVSFIEKTETGTSLFSYVAQDITEMRSAQTELEIANTLPQIIWLARPDGFVYWYNEWYYSYTGFSRTNDQWDDKNTSPIHPDDIKELVTKWQHSLHTGEPTYVHFRIRRNDGEYRWHLSRGVPVRDENNKIIKWIGSNTDVHDNLVLVDKLEKEHEARERFVAALSHDLRTPLTAAKMSAQIISRKASDVDLVTRSSARIVENMNRADTMIRDILDAHRIKAGEKIALEFGHCNLKRIITDSLDDLRTLHGDRFIFRVGHEIEGNWSCNGIRRILENLCNNAIKYGSAHEQVTIELKDAGEEVLLSIHNEGDPIPVFEQDRLFDPYRRAENAEVSKQRGWGLGLTLVKGIAEAHGGHVTVTSSAQEGTTFTVYLPKHFEN